MKTAKAMNTMPIKRGFFTRRLLPLLDCTDSPLLLLVLELLAVGDNVGGDVGGIVFPVTVVVIAIALSTYNWQPVVELENEQNLKLLNK
jgi:hypothetical protein